MNDGKKNIDGENRNDGSNSGLRLAGGSQTQYCVRAGEMYT